MTKEELQRIKRNYRRICPTMYCPGCGRQLPLGEFRNEDNRLLELCRSCREQGRKRPTSNPKIYGR